MNDQGSFAKDLTAVCGATILLVGLLLVAVLLWAPTPARGEATTRSADKGGAPEVPLYIS